ncbi:LacI family DNA-binding transcriptional regulator [Inquilinus sp. NPDC058860]|uniref:LacI family DNA-binding transcriptional regulator n=1 Tax=Inquilinus sp. NPDC058860 TaxID=3346652 RepID=UPI0036B55DEA
MTTLRDVANRAGVSIGSVSAVINRTAPVSATLRLRVLAAIDELGYAPDGVARSLKTGRTRTIGLVIPDITNPLFAALAATIERACDAAGYALVLCATADDPEKELRHLRLMRTQRADGLILVLSGVEPGNAEAIRRLVTMPAVLVDRTLRGLADFDSVTVDNRAAARLAVEHMIRSGHRRIGIVTGRPGISISTDRFEGYREALAEAGIPLDDDLAACGDFRIETAMRAAAALLQRRPQPTAVFSTSNLTTIGVMRAIAEQGLRCPDDVSVAGIDDFEWSTAFSPRLTAVVQPVQAIGGRAVECLLARLSGPPPAEPVRDVFAPQLVVRESCRVIG